MKHNNTATETVKESRYTTHPVELRADGDNNKRTVTGYAAKFNTESDLIAGYFVEIIEEGAFDDVLGDDVRALFNHDANKILARSKSGTLKLSVDSIGLKYEFEAPDTTAGNDLIESLRRGDIDQSSFAFQVAYGGSTWETVENDDNSIKEVRRITKIKRLFDVSPVTYPAYPDTDVALRSYNEYKKTNEKPPHDPDQDLDIYYKRMRLMDKARL